jgi:hypothetical protein
MSIVEQRQQWRDDYLVAFYDVSGGNAMGMVASEEIAKAAAVPMDEIMSVGQFLKDQHLIEFRTAGGPHGVVSMTGAGIRRAEDIISRRESAALPHISGIVVLTDVALVRTLEPLLDQFRSLIEHADMDPETAADLNSDMDSAAAQARASHPNRKVIRAAIERAVTIAAPFVVLGSALLNDVNTLMRGLGH